jgi:hypothetical protein
VAAHIAVWKETDAPSTPAPGSRGRGRGRGRGGEGRGGAPPRLPVAEMTASGPFAMGPALAGSSSARRGAASRSTFTPIVPGGPGAPGASALGQALDGSAPPSLRAVKGKERAVDHNNDVKKEDEEAEVYSDPDDGIEIVDMDDVKTMDWMAPDSLRRDRESGKKNQKRVSVKVKKEDGVEEFAGSFSLRHQTRIPNRCSHCQPWTQTKRLSKERLTLQMQLILAKAKKRKSSKICLKTSLSKTLLT